MNWRLYDGLTMTERVGMSAAELHQHAALMQHYLDTLPALCEDEKVFYLLECVFDRAMILKLRRQP